MDCIGLDYIIENSDYVVKLATALDTNNEIVKKQVFELISALCTYNQQGYARAIETLENYKNLKKERYRFKLVINELEKTLKLEYKVTLLTFINCLIISAGMITDRIRIRNEFIGLGILPVLNNLRKIGNSVPDINIQLEVFDEQRECDESQSLQGLDGINLNSHLDIFYAIFRQVVDTPQEIRFLHILQHLLRIDAKNPISDCIWSTLEALTNRTTLIENESDAERILRTSNVQKISCPHCNRFDSTTTSARKFSLNTSSSIVLPPPPPPQQQIATKLPPPPPPIPSNSKGIPPPPLPNFSSKASNSNQSSQRKSSIDLSDDKPLPQQEIPVPRSKMKTINWNKIPHNRVVGKNNIWSIVANNHENSPLTEISWEEMEGLFCQQVTQGSPKLGRETSVTPGNSFELRSKRDNEISLLDGKRSLNVNIFLKQFRSSNTEIIRMIREGEHDAIGLEKLRGLLKILPEFDELEILRNFEGDANRLGQAEKFLLELLKLTNYKLRIECMLLKEEFAANLSYIEPSINSMLYAGEDLMTSKALQEIFFIVIVVGNFLNSGGYAGNAAGIKLTSIQKLTEIRANKPGMNLIHFVALQAEKRNKILLSFTDQMSNLENASKSTIEQLNNEISALSKRINAIKKQIELPSIENDIILQMEDFIQAAENELEILQRKMTALEKTRVQLADFFCEDPSQFKIEECFKIFYQFCDRFKTAVKDNEKRKIQEEQASLRRKQREEQLAMKRKQYSQCVTPSDSEKSFLMDPPTISYDIRFSPAMRRRFSPNINNADPSKDDGVSPSPDITPNGSLRRRRSRVLSEEDEGGLMDFLRSSGHDCITRERKSLAGYGSLDRSWARRKQRPDLLNVDFGVDRERPSSPVPSDVSKNQQQPQTQDSNSDPKPRISREWRQKIENWLQANEQDDKQNDEYRRKMKRIANIRRTLETEAESEKGLKLDTLPEEREKLQISPKQVQLPFEKYLPRSPEKKHDHASTEIKSQLDGSRLQSDNKFESEKDKLIDKSPQDSSSLKTGQCKELDSNKQTIYIRPTDDEDEQANKATIFVQGEYDTTEDQKNILKQMQRRTLLSETNNKIEIDSDNIETPPTVRKNLGKSFKGIDDDKNSQKMQEQEILGDGQFNRFSSARRTRRYKRPVDLNCVSEDNAALKSTIISPETMGDECAKIIISPTNKKDKISPKVESKDGCSKSHSSNKDDGNEVVKRIGKIGKSISRISQEDVREALRTLKSSPEAEWSKKDLPQILPKMSTSKIISHELNDEGFEETQSLVSDTPSLTTSSCNDEAKTAKENSPEVMINVSPAVPVAKRRTVKPSNQLQSLLTRNQQSLERSRSLRTSSVLPSGKNSTSSSVPPRRVNSMKKLEKPEAIQKSSTTPTATAVTNKHLFVKRSNSRTSLISSISSLNSTVSTNTVKKMPIKSASASNASSSSSTKKPLILINNSSSASSVVPRNNISRVPASRSSSSGSSIGPRPTSSKTSSSLTNSNSTVKQKDSIQQNNRPKIFPSVISTNRTNQNPSPSKNSSSFMRPTAASATKIKSK